MRICSKCGEKYKGAEVFCSKDGARIIDPDVPLATVRRSTIPPPPQEQQTDPFIDTLVQGRYRVLSKLGEGGMGVVYVAEHVEIEKKVALKVLRDDFSNKKDVVERFRQEARSASKIGNPHIVDVTDFGQLKEGGVYFAMELLEGVGLSEVCDGTPMSLDRAAPIIEQIAKALQAAHDKGIVHRDLKPENIFLVNRDERTDFVKILDFGIAKISDRDSEGKRLTQTGMIFGTPEYMSPEQAAGKKLDHRVDVYALGCIMFELFTGKVPYQGESFMAILTQHMFEPIPDIKEIVPTTDVPDSVLAVVYKAMAKEADCRYSDMNSLREDLVKALEDANYVINYPDREQTISVGRRRSAESRTFMDWSSQEQRGGVSASKPKGLVIGLIVATAALMLGAGAYFMGFIELGKKPEPKKTHTPIPVATPVDTTPLEKTDGPAPQKLKVTLGSLPAGALILVEGMGQVCSSAPCEVMVEPGTPIKVTAQLGEKTKEMTFTPSQQNREVLIELDVELPTPATTVTKKKRPSTRAGRKSNGKRPEKTSSGSGGLKIPDVFKNN